MTEFTILEQGDLVPRQKGRYLSFPSLTRDPRTRDILILYREANFDPKDPRPEMKAHGLDGCLNVMRYHPGQNCSWSKPEPFLASNTYPPGLIDGVLTTWGNRLHVMVRGFPRNVPAYYSYGPSLGTLKPFRPFPSRFKMRRGAQWGKIVAADQGKTLYQVYYGGPWEMYGEHKKGRIKRPMTRPALYTSTDSGHSWHFKSWISPLSLEDDVSGDETSLLHHQGVLYALIRTMGDDSGPLFLTRSLNRGRTWETPWRSGLHGQAPMFYKVPGGPILLGYRGYTDTPKDENGNFSLSVFHPETLSFSAPFVVEAYKGNRYDGGYGDLIWLPEENRLLTVYYYAKSPKQRHPWLRYSFIALEG